MNLLSFIDQIAMKKLISYLTFILITAQVAAQNKLPIPQTTVLSGKAEGVGLLFDGDINTGWFPGWDASKYPVQVRVDFGEPVAITKIRIFDAVGKPIISFIQSNGSTSNLILSTDLSLYLAWQERSVSSGIKAQYVIISISEIQGDIPVREIEFFGGKDIIVPPAPTPLNFNNLTGDAKKLGLNGFHWIPNDLIPLPNLRVYQMSQWTWTASGIMVDPSFQADANYDAYYKKLKSLGITVVPCINQLPYWLGGNDPDYAALRMCNPDFMGNDPSDYIDVAAYAWQIAARYGSKVYPANALKVNQTPRWNGDLINEKKSGLNILKYIELENEPDRPWKDVRYKYTPEQTAAFLSAAWDGHEGKMGQFVGIKNADPNVKVVMPGLAEINIQYLYRMKVWFENNRKDKKFCADVINFHHYSNSSNPKWPAHSVNLVNGKGISPEADGLDLRLKDVKQFVTKNFPKGTEIWYSEFGYDTYNPSQVLTQYPLLYGTHTSEELQSWWLQRIFLTGLNCGIDKMYLFNGIDENNAHSGNLFASSGVMAGQAPATGSSFAKKPSYLALQSLLKELNGYTFNADRSVGGVTVLEFRRNIFKKYFYWSPTSNDSKVEFKIGKQALTAKEFPQVYNPKAFDNVIGKDKVVIAPAPK